MDCLPVLKIHCPGTATFEVDGRLTIAPVLEPLIWKNLIPSPAFKPAYNKTGRTTIDHSRNYHNIP